MDNKFLYFKYTSESCNDWVESWHKTTGPSYNQCSCICWPLILIFDIFSCPCRRSYHYYKYQSKFKLQVSQPIK